LQKISIKKNPDLIFWEKAEAEIKLILEIKKRILKILQKKNNEKKFENEIFDFDLLSNFDYIKRSGDKKFFRKILRKLKTPFEIIFLESKIVDFIFDIYEKKLFSDFEIKVDGWKSEKLKIEYFSSSDTEKDEFENYFIFEKTDLNLNFQFKIQNNKIKTKKIRKIFLKFPFSENSEIDLLNLNFASKFKSAIKKEKKLARKEKDENKLAKLKILEKKDQQYFLEQFEICATEFQKEFFRDESKKEILEKFGFDSVEKEIKNQIVAMEKKVRDEKN